MTAKQSAIGVFDSGMGGLTVLRALRQELPYESFVYLGDTARLPYGTKSQDTVHQYALQMARVLVERQIKALVIACNTATTAALPHLQSMLPDMPVMGVIEPGAAAAVQATRNQHIAVLATETTIASNAYQLAISAHLPKSSIYTKAASLLVALAEEGMNNNEIASQTLHYYLDGLTNEDTLLLGCTHFPVFKPLLSSVLPQSVKVVDSALSTATALKQLLARKNLLSKAHSYASQTQYLVTDSVSRFQSVGEVFLGDSIDSSDVELIDV